MGRDAMADRERIGAALNAIEAGHAVLEDCCFDALSAQELMEVLARREAVAWRAPVVDHQILARLAIEDVSGLLGAASLPKALRERLRISAAVARRRVAEAADLGPRTAVSGEPLAPVLPELAAAQAGGRVGPEHVVIARKTMAKIPAAVPAADRERAEADLAVLAGQFDPETFQQLADRLLMLLNQDGQFSDAERQAHRSLRLGRQGTDGMSTLSGKITPELRATLEPILAKLAAPGMCNSADEHPCVSGTPTAEQIERDDRRPDQRAHDALLAAARAVLACGDLGQLNGLPVTVIVSTTLAELQAATGKAHTAGGSLLPMGDLLRMASHAHHYLSIFDGKGRALWLGRTKRLATGDQRIVLHARDRGCTCPGCTVPGYLTQAHHMHEWGDNGHTDIDELTLACAPDNRMATEQGWTTQLGETGRVEWFPPPALDRGQPRTNPYHFIETIIDTPLRRPRDTEQPPPNDPEPDWPEQWPDDESWPDGPQPGDFDYDAALEDLRRDYDLTNLEELAARHFP
ncbi:HNH endonuclease signature motif containing protein [Mycolicibacter sp. MYC123]|uniref:HNH endonuclease signature motif containing protein n=1 Tax=[Mycobacterium] zoologicum TaxID=2872311 RepID=A0ABU5YIM9_9MYCO|nr:MULTISPECIES: HNH endonuclease signature motif containing protein [unclassified Mycolicibacter]MEB3048854.1 HNH endonuclease signature motif containing protein [Mycolicibacter sp. MYC123]MEB3062066.1 HNH endonuclease signature motif containing protein [Mycolicibacter sp. MYC101]